MARHKNGCDVDYLKAKKLGSELKLNYLYTYVIIDLDVQGMVFHGPLVLIWLWNLGSRAGDFWVWRIWFSYLSTICWGTGSQPQALNQNRSGPPVAKRKPCAQPHHHLVLFIAQQWLLAPSALPPPSSRIYLPAYSRRRLPINFHKKTHPNCFFLLLLHLYIYSLHFAVRSPRFGHHLYLFGSLLKLNVCN